ncbi:MAG: sensor histidine kinase, partial [Chloroflexota bacterium]
MTKRLLHVRRWRPGLLAALAATWRRAVHDQLRAWVGGRVAAGRAGPAPSLPGGPGGSEDRRLAQDASEAAALRRLAELKDELMRTVSHELRTPLSYIYGYSELLSVSTALPERERKMAVEIHRAAEHMRRLIDDLLDLGQIESGDVPLDLMPADVGDSIEQAIQDVQAIEGSTHRFTVEVAPDLPAAIADPSRLQQVLMHLLTNAVRYSPRESEVRAGAHLRYDVRGPKSQVQGHTGGMLPQDMGPSDVGLASDAGAGQGQLVEVWVADQ